MLLVLLFYFVLRTHVVCVHQNIVKKLVAYEFDDFDDVECLCLDFDFDKDDQF